MKKFAILTVLPILVIAVSAAAFVMPRAEANSQCHGINSSLISSADLVNFTTAGKIKSGFLKGTTQFIGDVTSIVPVSGATSPPLVPSLLYIGDLTVTTKKGTLTSRGVGVFELGPFGVGTQFDQVIGGTGIFSGATGTIYYNYVANAAGDGFISTITGEVCLAS